MGQRFIPKLHDPDCQTPNQKSTQLSEEQIDRLFEAIIAEMDARERTAKEQVAKE